MTIPYEDVQEFAEQKEISIEEAQSILQDRIDMARARERFKKAVDDERETVSQQTLDNLYRIFDKYLYLPDKRRVDLILAVAISKKELGTPLWVIIVGSSGDAKSELLRTLEHYEGVQKIDQITPNTLASGKSDTVKDKKTGELIQLKAQDLGSKLANNSTLLLIYDLAVFSSKSTDDKNLIWAQFRNLYDGFITKMTGNGVDRAYENCHVTLLGCSTNTIRDELIVHSQLGTREMMWDTAKENKNGTDAEIRLKKTQMAWGNEKYEATMRKEIEEATLTFLRYHPFKRIPDDKIPEEMREYLIQEAQRLTILRANVIVDQQHREVINPVVPETPTRLIKQFKRIYLSLKSLDANYPDDRIKEIIKILVDSSGNVVRQMIMQTLQTMYPREMTIRDIQETTRIGRNSVKAQLEILWNLGVVSKECRTVLINDYQSRDVELYKWVEAIERC